MYARQAPEYLPRLEYCALMASVERFIADSTFQYSRQSFQNRARLRTPDGIQWISVPLTGGQYGKSIATSEIDYSQNWIRAHEKAFIFNYGSAPFFDYYMPPIQDILRSRPATLGMLTTNLLESIHGFLELSCTLVFQTPGDGGDQQPKQAGRRAVLPGSVAEQSAADGSDRIVLEFDHPEYRQNFPGFEPGLSTMDLLFNHGPESSHILMGAVKHINSSSRQDSP